VSSTCGERALTTVKRTVTAKAATTIPATPILTVSRRRSAERSCRRCWESAPRSRLLLTARTWLSYVISARDAVERCRILPQGNPVRKTMERIAPLMTRRRPCPPGWDAGVGSAWSALLGSHRVGLSGSPSEPNLRPSTGQARAPAFSRFVMIRPVQTMRPRSGIRCFCTGQGPPGRPQRSGHRPHNERTTGPCRPSGTGVPSVFNTRILGRELSG
jgi:hypothetical protein